MQDDLTYPYNRDSFVDFYNDYAFRLFSRFHLIPKVSKANLRDAFTIWQDENFRWACSFGLRNDAEASAVFQALREGDLGDPSHLKKASALCCAFNRTKPILELNEVDRTSPYPAPVDFDAPGMKSATLFSNEFFALRAMVNYVYTDERGRTDIAPLVNYEEHMGIRTSEELSDDYIVATCRYLRLRSPSPSSIYQMVRSLTYSGYEWRRATK